MAEQHTARTDDTGDAAIYVVAYFEVMPPSAPEAAVLLRQYSQASRTDAGFVDLEVMQQCARPDHFAIVETWQDQTVLRSPWQRRAHARHARTAQTLRCSPYDERLHQGFALGAAPASRPAGAIYAVTHADAIPPAKDDAMLCLSSWPR